MSMIHQDGLLGCIYTAGFKSVEEAKEEEAKDQLAMKKLSAEYSPQKNENYFNISSSTPLVPQVIFQTPMSGRGGSASTEAEKLKDPGGISSKDLA